MPTTPVHAKLTLDEIALRALDPDSSPPEHTPVGVALPRYTPQTVSQLAVIAGRALNAPLSSVTLASEYFARCPASPLIELATFDRSASLAAAVMMSGAPLRVSDAVKDAKFRALRQPPADTVAFAGVPILATSGAVIGALSVRDQVERHFTAQDVETLEMIAWFIAREVEFCDLCSLKRGAFEPQGTLALAGRSILIVGPPGLSRDVMQDWLTNAGALVDATSPGPSLTECLADSAMVGVPYSVIVLDAGLCSIAATLRAEGCTVPIVAFRPPGVSAEDPQFAGCTTVLPTPVERGALLTEACRRVSTPPAA